MNDQSGARGAPETAGLLVGTSLGILAAAPAVVVMWPPEWFAAWTIGVTLVGFGTMRGAMAAIPWFRRR